MKVHSALGPGLLESAYQACLGQDLTNRGIRVETQVALPVVYKGKKLEVGYRIDLVVERRVVFEIKSVEAIHPIHEAQLLSYMRLSGIGVGLLINFNILHLRNGIKRMVDGHEWEALRSSVPSVVNDFLPPSSITYIPAAVRKIFIKTPKKSCICGKFP